MSKLSLNDLSRRERQIMDIIYRERKATAATVMEALPDSPSYSAIRTFLRILEEKGFLEHERDGARYVFKPCISIDTARKSAMKNLYENFFNSSTSTAVATLLDVSRSNLTEEDFDRLRELIEKAQHEVR